MDRVETMSRRRGGREARRELRAAPIPRDERAVKPGMEGGGPDKANLDILKGIREKLGIKD